MVQLDWSLRFLVEEINRDLGKVGVSLTWITRRGGGLLEPIPLFLEGY